MFVCIFRSFRTKGSRPTPDRYVRATVKVEKNKLANGVRIAIDIFQKLLIFNFLFHHK